MDTSLKEESIFIEINSSIHSGSTITEELHVKRFYTNENASPVLMIHGSNENGRIFYSSSGKGLAPYLAQNGFDVFVPDLRGRGLSTPAINKNAKHGLTEILRDDFPAYIHKIKEIKGDVPLHWVSHSWGGVLILAYLAKNLNSVKAASMVFFAVKRRLSLVNLEKIWNVNILYNMMAPIGIAQYGFLPIKRFNMGSDNETKRSYHETKNWLTKKRWLDWNDQFDYAAALKKIKLPPILYLTGAKDTLLGNPKDVKLLIEETGNQDHQFLVLGKATGYKQDYGHIDILTHKDALADVYPLVSDFMKKHP